MSAAAARRSTCSGQSGPREVEQRVGTKRRDDAPLPARVGRERAVVAQVVGRVVGRRKDLDAEALVQRPRTQRGSARRCVSSSKSVVGRRGGRRDPHAQHVVQDELEPQPHDRPGEQRPALAQPPPDRARVGRRAQRVERDAVGVQQARDVVVGRHEQRRRVGERRVVREQRGSTCPCGETIGASATCAYSSRRDAAHGLASARAGCAGGS